MQKIHAFMLALVVGIFAVVFASLPQPAVAGETTKSCCAEKAGHCKMAPADKAKASCCADSAACCKEGAACCADKTAKGSCCADGAACCKGGACCAGHKA